MFKSVKYMLRELDDFEYLIGNRYYHPDLFVSMVNQLREFINSCNEKSISKVFSGKVYEVVTIRMFRNIINLLRKRLPTNEVDNSYISDINKFFYVTSILLDSFFNELKYELWDKYKIIFLDYERENYPIMYKLYFIEKHQLN